jgi:hypothetical protein
MKPGSRRDAIAGILISVLILLMTGITGCGGTRRRGPSVANPGTNGSLRAVQIRPTPGATFISRNTIFEFSWTEDDPPPSSFSAALRRYKEARGEEARVIETQVTELTRQGDSFIWTLKRRDNFDLDSGGVYFLELVSSGESVFATYIVSNDRSVETRTEEKFVTNTGGKSVGMVHTVEIP